MTKSFKIFQKCITVAKFFSVSTFFISLVRVSIEMLTVFLNSFSGSLPTAIVVLFSGCTIEDEFKNSRSSWTVL